MLKDKFKPNCLVRMELRDEGGEWYIKFVHAHFMQAYHKTEFVNKSMFKGESPKMDYIKEEMQVLVLITEDAIVDFGNHKVNYKGRFRSVRLDDVILSLDKEE